MKRYTVVQVRERLAEALDRADEGVPVVIERRGVRYRLTAETGIARVSRGPVRIETIDPAVARGEWQWRWTEVGAVFTGRRARR